MKYEYCLYEILTNGVDMIKSIQNYGQNTFKFLEKGLNHPNFFGRFVSWSIFLGLLSIIVKKVSIYSAQKFKSFKKNDRSEKPKNIKKENLKIEKIVTKKTEKKVEVVEVQEPVIEQPIVEQPVKNSPKTQNIQVTEKGINKKLSGKKKRPFAIITKEITEVGDDILSPEPLTPKVIQNAKSSSQNNISNKAIQTLAKQPSQSVIEETQKVILINQKLLIDTHSPKSGDKTPSDLSESSDITDVGMSSDSSNSSPESLLNPHSSSSTESTVTEIQIDSSNITKLHQDKPIEAADNSHETIHPEQEVEKPDEKAKKKNKSWFS